MKTYNLSVGLLLASPVLAAASSLRLVSYNIRQAVLIPGIGERLWSVRRPLLSAQINYETAGRPDSLLCMQEVLHQQLTDILSDLGNDKWAHIGVGRDDGQTRGEYSPILYRPGSWNVESNQTYWLSEKPDVPGSKGWDAAYPRILTVARLMHKQTGSKVVLMCTHFDHVGQVAREKSADMIARLASQWEGDVDAKVPVFLAGDLNSDVSNKAYQTLASQMRDVKDAVPKANWHGSTNTFTAFTTTTSDDQRLDYVFVKDPAVGGLLFSTYGVVSNRFDDGIFISDHRPVVVDVDLGS